MIPTEKASITNALDLPEKQRRQVKARPVGGLFTLVQVEGMKGKSEMDFKTVTSNLLTALKREHISYALIGGFAVSLWGYQPPTPRKQEYGSA